MCTGLEIIALAGTALAGVGSAVSIAQQSQAASSAAAFQAETARRAEMVSNWQASDALQRGDVLAQRRRMEGDQLLGQQTAALAAQGTDLSGSSSDILGDTAAINELDRLTIKSNSEREAWAYKVKAYDAAAEARFASERASTISSSMPWAVGASLIGTAGTVAGRWYQFKKPGVSLAT